jgi:putative endopeptidase
MESLCELRPQDDFYNFVNKKWLDDPKNQIPDDYSRWGGFVKLYDECLINQINLIKNLANKSDRTEEENKIYSIWTASCKKFNEFESKKINREIIKKEFEILDSHINDQFDITRFANYFHYTQIYGIGNVFDFDQGSDLLNSNNIVLDFSISGLSLPSREYYTDDKFKEKLKLYRDHLENIADLVGIQLLTADFAQNVIDFESELAKYQMTQEQKRKYDEYYTNTTLTELANNLNSLNYLSEKENNYSESEQKFKFTDEKQLLAKQFFETVYELFDFKNILFNNLTKNFADVADPPNSEHVTVYDGDGVRRVMNMLLSCDVKKYKSYLQYKIIKSVYSFCDKYLDDEFFDFYSRKLRGQLKQLPNEKRSINIVNNYAGEMMGKLFVAKYFPEEHKNNVKLMISEIIDVMKQSIETNDWLTASTKLNAIKKLDKFNVKIGFPDVWEDYSELNIVIGDNLYEINKKVREWKLQKHFFNKLNSTSDRNEWHMTPQTVNAYFSPSMNEIVFPAAILQAPFYCKDKSEIDFDITDELKFDKTYDFSMASNYGGISAVIAHEITHGYDDKGRKFDGNGNLNDWWTEEDTKLFTEKTKLMEQQSEKYIFTDNDVKYKMNPKLTMGENLADLGGISLALKGLTKRLSNKGASLDELRANQRVLFKSFANIWKENTKPDFRINGLTTDPHAPPEFRANLVKNMGEFYDLFNVVEGDRMYIPPEKRVRMW